MGNKTTQLSLDERIGGVVKDSADIIIKLSKLSPVGDEPIEIVSELPAAADPDIILGNIKRWQEIQKYFNRDLRVYAWSYTVEVEKYVLGVVQNMPRVAVTILPMYLKETKRYE